MHLFLSTETLFSDVPALIKTLHRQQLIEVIEITETEWKNYKSRNNKSKNEIPELKIQPVSQSEIQVSVV